eukprot:236253-Prorocentrum_lima.AAC.1
MTSSLVGSEMCIRDRPKAKGPPARQSGRVHAVQDTEVEGQGEAACSQVPVSYTHLTLPTICSV